MSRVPQKLTELIVLWLKGYGIDAGVEFYWGCDLIVGAKYTINIWSPIMSDEGSRVSIGFYDNLDPILNPMEVVNFNQCEPEFLGQLAERLGL